MYAEQFVKVTSLQQKEQQRKFAMHTYLWFLYIMRIGYFKIQ